MSSLRVSRRGALRLFGGAGMAAVLAPALASCAKPGDDGINPGTLTSKAKLPEPFSVPLPILQALAPDSTDAQGVHFSMTLKQAEVEILPGYKTKVFGYNGTFPGPYLDVHAGTPMVVHQTNQLPVPIVTHLHGGLTPPADDGFPTDLVFPQALADMANPGTAGSMPGVGGMEGMDGMPTMADPLAHMTAVQRDYVFPLNQRAATLWYHDHRMDFSGAQVWRGLFGLCVVRDAEDDKLPLPKGDREIPLMIADRAFDADGQLIYPVKDPTLLGKPGMDKSIAAGAQGDVILVNGAPWPYLEVAAVKYRLRLVNASNARRYELELDGPGGGEFVQVGSDGGLLAAPLTHSTLHMSPAERFDVVVDFSKYPVGSTVTLKNSADSGGPGRVMQFKVTSKASDDSSVPATLSTIEKLTVDGAKRRLVFALDGDQWHVNGKAFDPAHPLLKPVFGKTEQWTVTSVERHPVHLHGAHFQVTGRGSGGLGEYDHGWKDTVELSPGSEITFAVRFDSYRGRYVAHCHNLEHEDMGMMATFQVV